MKTYVCSVADALCQAAANHPNRHRPLPQCFACGQDVCRNCSSKRRYPSLIHGKTAVKPRRICNDCQVDRLDGGSDARVKARMCQTVYARDEHAQAYVAVLAQHHHRSK